jgi:Na+/H+ antiporter NhaD/arsenite permease-like protein
MSNLISNVPVILMLRPVLEVLPASTQLQVWVITAWVATLAGNFIILGSAANLIVAHQAAKLGDGSFTAIEHGKFGLPSTTLLLFGGMAIIHQAF